ncbi:hypothetical protein HID58_060223 [Brassica napus]|uniref:Uncharacterized protein n=1 Tax=Brassica napus TaxID=3708 RepID=A0ABQ7ZV68_BRANA|nr:hypothetical protein HID58_060223 [Brassica napus]
MKPWRLEEARILSFPGKVNSSWNVCSPASFTLLCSNWTQESEGQHVLIEAVFPALGRYPFAEQLQWNLMSTKRRSIHPAIIFPGALLMTPPVFGIRPSGIMSLDASVASRACYPLILMLVETAPGAEGNQMLLKGDSRLGPGVGRNQRLRASFRFDESKSFLAPKWLGLRDF